MKICFLTQTANELPTYYANFFKGMDLYYITFKSRNPDAIAFLPNSSWAEGRNFLWETFKNRYDYYVFLDDDLIFFNFKRHLLSLRFLPYIYYRLNNKTIGKCYEEAQPNYFFSRLKYYLNRYRPEILAPMDLKVNPYGNINGRCLKKNIFVRRLGYFDPHFSVFSNYGANMVLPYDTTVSGWWSAQIPVYLYAYHVFAKKAIDVIDLGIVNFRWSRGTYFPGYDGYYDCRAMLEKISEVTNKDYLSTAGPIDGWPINYKYGSEKISIETITDSDKEDYQANYLQNLQGLEKFLNRNILPE